jgi:PKD repeat protein
MGLYREPFTVTFTGVDTPPITLSDIESFRPETGVTAMEPNGWIVVGMNTNFYSTAVTHEVAGSLLGFAASVRFTPEAWQWGYGDGAVATTSTPGASWAALGLVEFDATSTSHVFTTPGSFAISLAIRFRAEYRFAGSEWVPIAGTLTVPSGALNATAGDAATVLVSRDCVVDPADIGCR